MHVLRKYVQLYIGCQTSAGKLIGVNQELLFILSPVDDLVQTFHVNSLGTTLFLHLKQLNDLNYEQSNELIKRGFNVGRPKGYAFSPEAFIFLLTLYVDLFGLTSSGFAKHSVD